MGREIRATILLPYIKKISLKNKNLGIIKTH